MRKYHPKHVAPARHRRTRPLIVAIVIGVLVTSSVTFSALAGDAKPTCHPKGRNGLPVCVATTTVPSSTSTTAPSTTSSTAGTTTSTTAPPTTTTTAPCGALTQENRMRSLKYVATMAVVVGLAVGCTDPNTLWTGNADTDVDQGSRTNCLGKDARNGGTLGIATDPLGVYGKVYEAHAVGDTQRAEWEGAYKGCTGSTKINLWGTDGPGTTDVYIGWRSQFTGNYALTGGGNDGNVAQWKGDSSCGGPAVGMTLRSNRLSLRTIDGNVADGGVEGLWMDPVLFSSRMNVWTSFVMRVNFSKASDGFIELWVNGVKQTMANGTQRFNGPTVCIGDTKVFPKWGDYSLPSGANAFHFLETPKIGTTYASVAP